MAQAARDQNRVTTLLGVSNVDSLTPVAIYADPSTHELLVSAAVVLAPNSSVNVNQIGGTAVAVGNGATDLGTQRVTISNDSTGQIQLAAGAASIGVLGANSGVDIGDVTVNNGAGVAAVNIQDGGNTITVDGTVNVNTHAVTIASGGVASGAFASGALAVGSVVAGAIAAGASSFVKLEDDASASADAGVPAMAIQRATPANTASDLDYSMLQMSAGRLWTSATIDAALPAGSAIIGALVANQSVNLAQVAGGTAINSGVTGAIAAGGDVANDAADSGNPVKIGGKALTAIPAAVTANDRIQSMFDVYGRQISMSALREMRGNQVTTITNSTSETTIVTADATYKLDLYGLIVTNTSATPLNVAIKDSNAGTTRMNIAVPANETRGFMLPADAGHKQNAVNTTWTATCSASVTSVIITALFANSL